MKAALAIGAVGLLVGADLARADIFLLHSGGEVRGELVNKDQSPRTNYHVKTPTGGHVMLAADQVKSVAPQSAAQLEYDQICWDYDDSIEEQWKLAEWCREKKLTKERRTHLENILALDPDHEKARHGLNYRQIGGKWVNERDYMESQGYVRYKNRGWITRQEVELLEQSRKQELAEKDWIIKAKRWRGWIDGDRAAEARKNFLAIKDPVAVKALAMALEAENIRDIKLLYVEALANIGAAPAMNVLVEVSIVNPDEEVRIACLDKIVRAGYSPAVATYVQKLKSPDNQLVNRAAVALTSMKDPSSVGPLIDALRTTHKYKIVPQNPGQMSSTFGGPSGSPGGFSFGQAKEKIVKRELYNQAVLDALVTITGENFNYEVPAWKYWYAARKKPASLDARRD